MYGKDCGNRFCAVFIQQQCFIVMVNLQNVASSVRENKGCTGVQNNSQVKLSEKQFVALVVEQKVVSLQFRTFYLLVLCQRTEWPYSSVTMPHSTSLNSHFADILKPLSPKGVISWNVPSASKQNGCILCLYHQVHMQDQTSIIITA